MEQQLLSNKETAPFYDKVTWLFVSRNFNDDAKDREAARTHDRFGVSSWPQLIVFDPRDDRVLAELPRDFAGFTAGLTAHAKAVPAAGAAAKAAAAKVAEAEKLLAAGRRDAAKALLEKVAAKEDDAGVWLQARELLREAAHEQRPLGERLQDPDVREVALALEAVADLPEAERKRFTRPATDILLGKHHLVVRLRALRLLAKAAPATVAEQAAALLAEPNDPFRFEVLGVLVETKAPGLTPTLLAMFGGAGGRVPSGNPNVLRIKIAQCLGAFGDASAIPPLAEVAHTADVRNGLTGTSIDALIAIADRGDAAARKQVVAALVDALPPALEEAGLEAFGDRAEPMLVRAAAHVRDGLDKLATGVPPARRTGRARREPSSPPNSPA
ncbi:MAG: hypothetical protein U1E73_01695 [Planctomycetota bacterium]